MIADRPIENKYFLILSNVLDFRNVIIMGLFAYDIFNVTGYKKDL